MATHIQALRGLTSIKKFVEIENRLIMKVHLLSKKALQQTLSIRDLSDPEEGKHALQLLIKDILAALSQAWNCQVHLYRESPIVSISDNYDKLHYPADGPARAARYTRYVCDTALLRTSTSAMIPKAMRALKEQLKGEDLIACPGLVYRRDSIDRLHLAEIHQMDLWRVSQRNLSPKDLHAMIDIVLQVALPGMTYRTEVREHPYTEDGLQIDVEYQGNWVEVGECGMAHPAILAENIGRGAMLSGLAMGLGLDRILMLRKGMADVRLVASQHPKIASQMLDLAPYKEVSSMPAVKRDLSLVVDQEMDAEIMGAKVRESLGSEAKLIESLEVLSESAYDQLPQHVIEKLELKPDQKNVLLRVVLRALDKTLTDEECNAYRDQIYGVLHEGSYWEWAQT